ncbi:MAG TPA: ATP-binding cassette domain-containing protein, partial [Candidatus Acetothermia bacterium]|nr:ATP-binding cassette domain-containing protein [Candidatus Acetothermia bacterium]
MTDKDRINRNEPSRDYYLRAEGITKVYSNGTVALKEADLEIHRGEIIGLLGENGAGKTTFTKILSGLLPPTKGRVISPRGSVRFKSPREALSFGIGMVYQHFALVGTFNAAENVALSHDHPFSPIQLTATKKKLEQLMEESGLRVPLDVPVEKLAVGEQQRVEILKVLSRDVDLLILDEPTSVLTPLEVDELFALLRRLKDAGKSIILITHKLKEVGSVTDRVVVLRHGEMVGDVPTAQASTEQLAQLMVGKALDEEANAVELQDKGLPTAERERANVRTEQPVLEVSGLTVKGNTGEVAVDNLSFEVYGGEIFGVAGVEGNGQSELVEALTGLRLAEKGKASINGKNILGLDPREIYMLGVAHIPE